MPTYLYECKKCGRFEKFQNIKAEALKKCPKCESEVKRIIGSPGILFKSSNFYVNQAKKDSSKSNKKDHKAS